MPNYMYPGYMIMEDVNPVATMRLIEEAYRLCYKSEGKMPEQGYNADFIRNKIKMGHETPLEHGKLTFKFIVDRGVTHEGVRHRIASPTQESTRYCNYGDGKLAVIIPGFWDPKSPIFRPTNPNWEKCMAVWMRAMEQDEENYNELIMLGASPQEARTVLSHSTKAEIIFTMNLRELRHFFSLRAVGTTGKPHPQMLEVTIPFLHTVKELFPVVFEDLSASF